MGSTMKDPRLKYAEWHWLGQQCVHQMPWSLPLWESLAKLQESGVPCPSCDSLTHHLSSCNIWCNVADFENKVATVGMLGIEAIDAKQHLEIEHLLSPDGPSKPTEENLTMWADGRFSANDQEMILKDEAICQLINETTVTEAVAEQCRKELREAAQRGYKENKE